MNRAEHIQELEKGFYAIQQKMLAKRQFSIGINHITFSQWRVLEKIDRNGKATIKEIHTDLGITSSAASQLVNELVRKKYVTRKTDPNDHRVSEVTLTPRMKLFLKKLKAENLKRMIELFEALTDREFTHYIELHTKIIKSI
jgi:DNA-binding MarR family transcriptional regulator